MKYLVVSCKQPLGKPPSGHLPRSSELFKNIYMYVLVKNQNSISRYFQKSQKYCAIILRKLLNFTFENTVLQRSHAERTCVYRNMKVRLTVNGKQ